MTQSQCESGIFIALCTAKKKKILRPRYGRGSPIRTPTWVVVDQGWGDPSVGGGAALAHGEVRLVGVLVLYVGLLGRHGGRHSHPGTLRLLRKTPQCVLLLVIQILQSLRLLHVDARQAVVES